MKELFKDSPNWKSFSEWEDNEEYSYCHAGWTAISNIIPYTLSKYDLYFISYDSPEIKKFEWVGQSPSECVIL